MYAIGETFYYEVMDEEYELHVIGDVILNGKEYVIADDFEGKKYAFQYDENEEELTFIEDEEGSAEILEHWEIEYFGAASNIGDWDEDSYYDREDTVASSDDKEENYVEVEEDDEYEEDVDSFISGLMGK